MRVWPSLCRLQDFCISDESGVSQPLERLHLVQGALHASGVVYPADGELARERGRKVDKFGPVKEWKILYSKDGAQVRGRVWGLGVYSGGGVVWLGGGNVGFGVWGGIRGGGRMTWWG